MKQRSLGKAKKGEPKRPSDTTITKQSESLGRQQREKIVRQPNRPRRAVSSGRKDKG